MDPEQQKKVSLIDRLTPGSAALLYAALATWWIIGSGALLVFTIADPVLQNRLELAKGLLFVAVTSTLLYFLLKRWNIVTDDTSEEALPRKTLEAQKRQLLSLLIIMFLISPLVGTVTHKLHKPQVEHEAYANLASVARLKAEPNEYRIAERQSDALAIMADEDLAKRIDDFVGQQHYGILSQPILDRFDNLHTANGHDSILLFDGSGRRLLLLGDESGVPPALLEQMRDALNAKQVRRGELYQDEKGLVHLDWVVPIVIHGTREDRAMATVVLRTTAQRLLYQLIQDWPTVSASAENSLIRRQGQSIIYLNDLRHKKNAALQLSLPLADDELVAARALQSMKPGTTQGKDYRGVPVMAAYRPVAGTDWRLVAKLDRAEALAPLHQLVLWV